jgi:hypothetical protein
LDIYFSTQGNLNFLNEGEQLPQVVCVVKPIIKLLTCVFEFAGMASLNPTGMELFSRCRFRKNQLKPENFNNDWMIPAQRKARSGCRSHGK